PGGHPRDRSCTARWHMTAPFGGREGSQGPSTSDLATCTWPESSGPPWASGRRRRTPVTGQDENDQSVDHRPSDGDARADVISLGGGDTAPPRDGVAPTGLLRFALTMDLAVRDTQW